MAALLIRKRLKKELGLLDIYAISTGAMFSSGFFLLPGLASAQAGPSVVLAYLIGGILVMPAMFSAAEMSTAMPRAGGPYYFLDRSMGPMVGTIGGLGTWFALVFKSAFALIGMGAYMALFLDLPIKPVALALTAVFATMNIMGAKKSSQLQVLLVIPLVLILVYFVAEGLLAILGTGIGTVTEERFTPFTPFGISGLISTVGFVFVSYAGLTQVASVSEEVRNPARDIPLGMMLSLLTATIIYVLGVYILVAVIDPATLQEDLTPVATASLEVMDRLPGITGLLLIVIAAVVAFASTGNAGIMSAARYPFAMARDRLLWNGFSIVGRFGTPTTAIIFTSFVMAFFIVVLDVEAIAKLASAFMLLIFGLLNLAVIIMRESKIASYLPDFRSPLYPWMQMAGVLTSLILIIEIGMISVVFTGGMALGCILWYFWYAHRKVIRGGAIFHLFARLGTYRFEELDSELRGILKERRTEEDTYDEIVARAAVIDVRDRVTQEELIDMASDALATMLPYESADLARQFRSGNLIGATPVAEGVALPHLSLANVEHPQLVLVRVPYGLLLPAGGNGPDADARHPIYALLFLVSDESRRGQHLRLLAHIATRIDEEDFISDWKSAQDEQTLKEILLRHERYLSLQLRPDSKSGVLAGRPLRDLRFPEGSLVAMIRRRGKTIVPRGSTVLEEDDVVTIIGQPGEIEMLYRRYVD